MGKMMKMMKRMKMRCNVHGMIMNMYGGDMHQR